MEENRKSLESEKMEKNSKERVEVKKGNVGVIFLPEMKKAFVVFGAPDDGEFLLFEGAIIFQKWAKKNGIEILTFGPARGAVPMQIPPELLMPPSPTIENLEANLNDQLEALRKKRIQDIEKGAPEKKDDESKGGVAS